MFKQSSKKLNPWYSDMFKKFDYRTIPGSASPSKKIRRGLSKKSESFSSNTGRFQLTKIFSKLNKKFEIYFTDGSTSFDKDFIRARNISVFSHGNKPRKMRRILLNKKVLSDSFLKFSKNFRLFIQWMVFWRRFP